MSKADDTHVYGTILLRMNLLDHVRRQVQRGWHTDQNMAAKERLGVLSAAIILSCWMGLTSGFRYGMPAKTLHFPPTYHGEIYGRNVHVFTKDGSEFKEDVSIRTRRSVRAEPVEHNMVIKCFVFLRCYLNVLYFLIIPCHVHFLVTQPQSTSVSHGIIENKDLQVWIEDKEGGVFFRYVKCFLSGVLVLSLDSVANYLFFDNLLCYWRV